MRWEIDQQAPEPPNSAIEKDVNRTGWETIRIEDLSLITPMLGGGVEALKNDLEMPIRVQSIRGQLRFWWRTFQKFRTVKELQEHEANLWGSTKEASRVNLAVTVTNCNWRKISYKKDTKANETKLPKYAIFPLDNTKDVSNFELIDAGKFTLTVSFPSDQKNDVMKALGMWYVFGGIGARTRRGMGSVYSPLWPEWKDMNGFISWLNDTVPNEPDNFQCPWPTLIGARLVIKEISASEIHSSWEKWIKRYQGFRQYRIDKKTNQPSPYGKSTWPEPTAIRGLDQKGILEQNAYFPRGAYGLPILFHFPQENMDYTLSGKDKDGNVLDRWASPIILKVTKLSNTKAGQLCLLLSSPLPEGWQISGNNKTQVLDKRNYPFASNSSKNDPPLNGDTPYDALIRRMSSGEKIYNLGRGGSK